MCIYSFFVLHVRAFICNFTFPRRKTHVSRLMPTGPLTRAGNNVLCPRHISSYRKHRKNVTNSIIPYPNQHARRLHADETCEVCRRVFGSSDDLERHFLDSPRHPKCKECQVGFRDKTGLKAVSKVHPWSRITLCCMKLTWKSCAVQHKDSVHPSDRGVKKEMNGMLSQDRERDSELAHLV